MLTSFIESATVILSTFTLSTMTTFFLCYFYDYPFFNPKKTTNLLSHQINAVIKSSSILVLEYEFIIICFMRFDEKPHSMIVSIFHIVNYAFLIELFYYLYHRIIHTKLLYKPLHSVHHQNVVVYPLDTFYFDIIDITAYVLCICLPLKFIALNYFEHAFVLYVYITASYLSHSKLFFTHHFIHHRCFDCNFCILIPIFDIMCGTYREKIE